jgi:uncharacterized protein YjbI with pentapeptide repeats
MRIIIEESIRPGWIAHSFRPPSMSGVFFAKLTCQLRHDDVATVLVGDDSIPPLGDVPGADEPSAPLRSTTDFTPYKPRFDFLLSAHAYTPAQTPGTTWNVGCRVGRWAKSLCVVGERRWIQEVLGFRGSEPAPIASLPMDYRLAFGGPSSKRNPVGRGYGDQAEWLPNIEYPESTVQRPDDDVPPAGFGPIAPSWYPRTECLGTYDKRWQQTRWPWYPEDFDYSFFNAAPPDQQFERPLVGDEELEFENLHPEHPVYRTRLPGVRVRCFISRVQARVLMPADQFTEVPLTFDTLHIDLNHELATLLWRGNAPVDSLKMTEIKTIFMMVEAVDARPQTHADCIDRFRRLLLDQMGMQETPLDQVTEEPDPRREFEKKMEATKQEIELRTQEAEAQQTLAREQAIAAGADPALFDNPPQATSVTEALAEAKASLKQSADSLRADNPELAQQIDKEVLSLEEVEAMLPRELRREQVEPMIAARESFANCSLEGLDLNGLDFSGLDCSTANFSNAKLQGANFTGANLSKANMREADLTKAILRAACLDKVDFSGAALQDGQFAGASLHGAQFADQQLTGNDFSSSHGLGADFSQSKVCRCNFNDARLSYSNFTAAEIVDTSFERAELKAAQFVQVRAQRVCMRGADLSGIHASDGSDFTEACFEQVQAVGSIWQDSVLDRANFSESQLSLALFTGASLSQARFDRSDLTKAVLDDANLEQASLDQCNLLYASLDRANLKDARMREANIYNAGFWEARLENLDRSGTSVTGTGLPS